MKYSIDSVSYGNFPMLTKESYMVDTENDTIGSKEVFFGTSLTGKTIYQNIILMLCILKKKNCDNILYTIMNVSSKPIDNEKARLDLSLYFKIPEMELQLLPNGKYQKPKALYSLTSFISLFVTG
jgi:hypothetical protein